MGGPAGALNPGWVQRCRGRCFGYPPVMTLPGSAVGAGGAVTDGVKEPTDFFSVGDGVAGALLSDGAFVSVGFSLVSLLHAVNEPMPTIVAAPATSATRRDK